MGNLFQKEINQWAFCCKDDPAFFLLTQCYRLCFFSSSHSLRIGGGREAITISLGLASSLLLVHEMRENVQKWLNSARSTLGLAPASYIEKLSVSVLSWEIEGDNGLGICWLWGQYSRMWGKAEMETLVVVTINMEKWLIKFEVNWG